MAADKKLTVTITGDVKDIQKALGGLADSSQSFGDKMKSSFSGALSVFGGNLMTKAFDGVKNLVVGSIEAAEKAAKIARETSRVIETTGGAAGVSASQVSDLAHSLSGLTGIDAKVVQGTENLLLTFTGVKNVVGDGNDIFNQATKAAIDMSVVLGTDASGAAIQLGKALNDPIKGITALSRAGVSFTSEQKEQIKTLVKSGDTLSAQKIILAELQKEFGGAAEAAATPLMKLQAHLTELQEKIGSYFLPAIDAAASWVGDRFPAAMAAGTAAIDRFMASAAPIANEVLARIGDAAQHIADNLGPAFANLGAVLVEVAGAVAPIAGYFAAIAGAAILGGLEGLSVVLKNISQFLRENVEVVKALATIGFVYLTVQIAATVTAYGELAAIWVAIKWIEAAEMIQKVAAAFLAARAAGSGLGEAMGAAAAQIGALGAAAGPVGVAIAAIGLIIYKVMQSENEGAEAAQRFRQSLEAKIDVSSYAGLQSELSGLTAKMTEVGHYGATMAERLNIFQYASKEGEFNEYNKQIDEIKNHMQAMDAVFDETTRNIAAQGPASMQTAAGMAQIRDRLVEIQAQGKIDLTAPGAAQKLMEVYGAAVQTNPVAAQLGAAFDTMSSSASNAADKVKAFKEGLDSLFGVQLTLWDSTTKVTQAIHGMADAHVRGAEMFNINAVAAGGNSAEVAKNRAELSAAIGSIRDHTFAVYQDALTHGTEQQAVAAASGTLAAHREELLRVMGQLGMTRGEAERYINQLGLTPDSVSTIIQLFDQGAPQKLGGIQNQLTDVGHGATATVTANTGQAEGALSRLTQLQRDYIRQASQIGPGGGMGAAAGLAMQGHANGAIVMQQYAEGHIAQIAPAGSMRLWAEPETGGEAYIPLAGSKRGRSTSILGQVASMFGYKLMPMANGGYNLGDAAMEMARAIRGGGRWWEDMSFLGESADFEAGNYNDKLADIFWDQLHPGGAAAGWDFGSGGWEVRDALSMLDTLSNTASSRQPNQGDPNGITIIVNVNGALVHNDRDLARYITGVLTDFRRQGGKGPWAL